MPPGASPKREREYQKIERKFKKEGRYRGREEEVAARIVNRQRAASGEADAPSAAASASAPASPHRHRPPRRSASRRKTRTARATPKRS